MASRVPVGAHNDNDGSTWATLKVAFILWPVWAPTVGVGAHWGSVYPWKEKIITLSFWLIPEQDPVHRVGFSLQP